MPTATIAEFITASFYAWETRGRGWMQAEYPVQLEPPYRPFFLLPHLAPERFAPIDDGKRHTIASFLIDGTKRLLQHKESPEPIPAFVEQPAFPALPCDQRAVLGLSIPPDAHEHPETMAQCITALAAARFPLSFEVLGGGGNITLQLACGTTDCDQVRDIIEGFFPEVAVTLIDDRLTEVWDESADHLVIDCGLSEEFFLPLPGREDFRIDPYVPLVAALSAAGSGEFLLLQVLIAPALNPWNTAIHRALDDGEGGCLIGDAPWFLDAAKKKTASRLFAALVRIGVQADDRARGGELLKRMQPFLLQYAAPNGNALLPLSNEDYPDELHAAALCARESYRTGMLLSAAELVALVHLPDASVRHPALLRAVVRSTALPHSATGHDLILGIHRHRGLMREAGIDHESRFAHTWVIGGSGTGKSTLLASMALQDITSGYGIAVFDPHGDLVDDIAARIPEERIGDVILFDPSDTAYPVGFNILEARTEIERNLLSSDLVAIVRRFTTSWGDTMSSVLGEAVLALLMHKDGGTLVELRRFLRDDSFRAQYLAGVRDHDVRQFWQRDYPLIGNKSIGPLLARLDAFLRPRIVRHIVGQPRAALDLAQVMEGGKIFLVKLSKGLIGEENASLLGSLLVSKFHQLALARQETPKEQRRPFFCYCDEFQHFVTPSMEALATEGRKYRFGLTLAHQMRAQLADVPRIEGALLGNCHTRIVFRVGEGDAKVLGQGFGFFTADDILRLGLGEAIARIGGAANDFNLRTIPLKQVDTEEAGVRRAAIVARTRERYAVPREELEAVAPPEPVPEQIPTEATPTTPPVAVAPTPRPPPMPPGVLETFRKRTPPIPASPGRGGAMHKYLQQLIKRLAEERGFRATVEGAAGDGQADVLLVREGLTIACEISITTDVAHEAENLKKCLAAGCTRVFFISPEKKQREKVTAFISTSLPDAPIHVLAPEDIVPALDALGVPQMIETTVRGYKVKVSRRKSSPEEDAERRKAIAGVIAKRLGK